MRGALVTLTAFGAVMLSTPCTGQDQLGSNTLSKRLSEVPPRLEAPFAEAIRAWERFIAADARLTEALNAERVRLDSRLRQLPGPRQTLADDNLNRNLYPWSWQDATGRSLFIDDEPMLAVQADAQARLTPELSGEFDRALSAWKDFRDQACALVALHATGEPGYDIFCVRGFNRGLESAAKASIIPLGLALARLRSDLPKFRTQGAKFHYVEIHSAEGLPVNGRTTVEVKVSDRSAPLVLMLRAYEPVEWLIKPDNGVRIRQAILFGQYRPTYRSSQPLEVRAYSPEEGNHEVIWSYLAEARDSQPHLRDALASMLGLAPATMQFHDCPENVCFIDGKRTWDRSTGEPVVWRLRDAASPRSAQVRNPDSGMYLMARASEARAHGRWYLEVGIGRLPDGYSRWAGGTVGVMDDNHANDWSHLLYKASLNARGVQILPGQTIRIAMDLDAARVYYGVDGRWVVGDPTTGQDGMALVKGRDHYPALLLIPRQSGFGTASIEIAPATLTGRFTAKDMAFPIPNGYLPYQPRRGTRIR